MSDGCDNAKQERNHHRTIEILGMMNETHQHLAEGAIHNNEALKKAPETRRRTETHIDVSGGICNKPYTHSCYKTRTPCTTADRNTRRTDTHLLDTFEPAAPSLQILAPPNYNRRNKKADTGKKKTTPSCEAKRPNSSKNGPRCSFLIRNCHHGIGRNSNSQFHKTLFSANGAIVVCLAAYPLIPAARMDHKFTAAIP